jgi:hypothetical protein
VDSVAGNEGAAAEPGTLSIGTGVTATSACALEASPITIITTTDFMRASTSKRDAARAAACAPRKRGGGDSFRTPVFAA